MFWWEPRLIVGVEQFNLLCKFANGVTGVRFEVLYFSDQNMELKNNWLMQDLGLNKI